MTETTETTETTEVTAPAEAATLEAPPTLGSRMRQAYGRVGVRMVAVLAAVLLGVLVALGFVIANALRVNAEEAGREAALHDARQFVANFTTIGYRTVDRDSKRVLDGSSGDFHAQYRNALASVRKVVVENKTSSTGTVLEAGLVSYDPDSARALVVADAKVGNTDTGQKPQLRTYRLQLDLVRQNNRWSVVDLQFVG